MYIYHISGVVRVKGKDFSFVQDEGHEVRVGYFVGGGLIF